MNKELEYAMLVMLYLLRAGTATLPTMAKNLSLEVKTLNRVCKALQGASLLVYTRGEGYTPVSDEVTVYDVLTALGNGTNLLDYKQYDAPVLGMERRSLKNYGRYFDSQYYKVVDVKLRFILSQQLEKEMYALERADERGTVN